MNELVPKLTAILKEMASKKEAVIKCFSTMSGLEISALSSDQKRRITEQFLAINEILKKYPIKTHDDYSLISDNHLNKLLKNIKQICLILYD